MRLGQERIAVHGPDVHQATGAEDAARLAEGGVEIGTVFEGAQGNHSIKGGVGKRERFGVATAQVRVAREPPVSSLKRASRRMRRL